MNRNVVLSASGVCKTWREIGVPISILNQLALQVYAGESVAILGASGSGKSTLLHILGGLEQADQGRIELLNRTWLDMTELEVAQYRNRHIGFVYQMHHLLPELSALENVLLPLRVAQQYNSSKTSIDDLTRCAMSCLDQVGLANRARHRPAELSGGERQRVSIARALVMKPSVVFADEPTGNLDQPTAYRMIDLFLSLCQSAGSALVLVTHDLAIAKRLNRQVRLENGSLRPENI